VSLPQIDRMDQPSVKLGLGVDEIAAAGFEHGDALRLETPTVAVPIGAGGGADGSPGIAQLTAIMVGRGPSKMRLLSSSLISRISGRDA